MIDSRQGNYPKQELKTVSCFRRCSQQKLFSTIGHTQYPRSEEPNIAGCRLELMSKNIKHGKSIYMAHRANKTDLKIHDTSRHIMQKTWRAQIEQTKQCARNNRIYTSK